MSHYPDLFRPGRIGTCELRNRVVMAPIGTTGGLVGQNGTFSDRAVTYYERRARGGTGLIITGLVLVNSGIEPWEIDGATTSVTFDSRWKVPNLLRLTERVHDFGAKIFVQLTAGFGRVFPGSWADRAARGGARFIAPSPTPLFWRPQIMAEELTTQEVDGLVRAFDKAASIAKEAQFDGIELHAHEGYLIDQFTTALWNRRRDRYGGDLEGRMKFPLEIIRMIQEAAGSDFPICYRYAMEHKIPGGRTVAEGIEMAKILEAAGVAALHVDAGCYDNWFWPHPPDYQPPACMVDMAEIAKQHVALPVITVGRLGYPDLADSVVSKGKADFVAIGRPLLADPDFAAKARRGEDGDIRPCIGCHECFIRLIAGYGLSCAVNPECGDEDRLALRPALVRKKVMVIGGGIAGMEAARVCSARGHEVTLYEKTDRLGGLLHAAGAADFKQDVRRLMEYQVRQVTGSGSTRIRTGTAVTADLIRLERPDVVFLALGSRPTIGSPIEGLDQVRWFYADDLYEHDISSGKKVWVIGGGSIGCEAALHLAREGRSVTVAEMKSELCTDLFEANRAMLLDLLKQHGVTMMTQSKVLRVTPGGVVISAPGGEQKAEADLFVLATGREPVTGLREAADKYAKDVYVIGDGVAPRKIKHAVWEAFKIATAL